MPLPADHYLARRLSAYSWTAMSLGPMAMVAGLGVLVAEIRTSSRRPLRELENLLEEWIGYRFHPRRRSFHAVAVCEVISGVCQLAFGIVYYIMLASFSDDYADSLEWAAEGLNLTYALSIVFCTTTITIVSYQRWIDVHQVRVGGVRPLHWRHWVQICAFTSLATLVIASNKVVYMHLKLEQGSELLQTAHTITQAAIILIWVGIFIACSVYNIRIIQIARLVRARSYRLSSLTSGLTPTRAVVSSRSAKGPPPPPLPPPSPGAPALNTRWIRLTLAVYNLASILFILKILDGIYLTESRHSYPAAMHFVGIVTHALQTAIWLALPVVWLCFCTHFYIDLKRARRPPPVTVA